MTLSTNQRQSVQDGSAFIFVPYDAGKADTVSDDSIEPGAILRLGGYSSVEAAAPDLGKFYPENHNSKEGNDKLVNAIGPASGKHRGGILLSCDGRMLMRTGEKLYLQSVGDMDIDCNANIKVAASGTVTVESGDAMTLRTYNAKTITISADEKQGDVKINGKKKEEHFQGDTYTVTDEKEYKLIKADAYTFRLAQQFSYTRGASVSGIGGSTTSLMGGLALSVNLSVSIALKISFDITLYAGKMDVGIYKFDVCNWKTELKTGEVGTVNNSVKASTTKTNVAAVKTDTTAVGSDDKLVDSGNSAVVAKNGGIENKTMGLINLP